MSISETNEKVTNHHICTYLTVRHTQFLIALKKSRAQYPIGNFARLPSLIVIIFLLSEHLWGTIESDSDDLSVENKVSTEIETSFRWPSIVEKWQSDIYQPIFELFIVLSQQFDEYCFWIE